MKEKTKGTFAMIEFYPRERLTILKKRAGLIRLFLIFLTLASLAAAIILCQFVKTSNASKLLLAIIIDMTLSGWVSILVLNLSFLPVLRESKHMEHILKEETSSFEGQISVSPVVFNIPKSIEIQKVTLKNDEEEKTFSIHSRYASLLPANGKIVRVKTAKGYITQAEVIR